MNKPTISTDLQDTLAEEYYKDRANLRTWLHAYLAIDVKGFIRYEHITGSVYPYLQWHENGKTKNQYLTQEEVAEVQKKLDHRNDLRKKIGQVLYELKMIEKWTDGDVLKSYEGAYESKENTADFNTIMIQIPHQCKSFALSQESLNYEDALCRLYLSELKEHAQNAFSYEDGFLYGALCVKYVQGNPYKYRCWTNNKTYHSRYVKEEDLESVSERLQLQKKIKAKNKELIQDMKVIKKIVREDILNRFLEEHAAEARRINLLYEKAEKLRTENVIAQR